MKTKYEKLAELGLGAFTLKELRYLHFEIFGFGLSPSLSKKDYFREFLNTIYQHTYFVRMDERYGKVPIEESKLNLSIAHNKI
ncbi:hypothetical protein D3C71_1218070 [compost metagenome]